MRKPKRKVKKSTKLGKRLVKSAGEALKIAQGKKVKGAKITVFIDESENLPGASSTDAAWQENKGKLGTVFPKLESAGVRGAVKEGKRQLTEVTKLSPPKTKEELEAIYDDLEIPEFLRRYE